MIRTQNIHSLTDFLRNSKAHIQKLKETKEPEVLTVNGKAELVVQDAESYQALLSEHERLSMIEAALRGRLSAETEPLLSLAQVRESLAEKYGI